MKILDLGVGVLIKTDDSEGTFATAAGFAVGTIEYMSPEQAEGRPLGGTRIYSRWAVRCITCSPVRFLTPEIPRSSDSLDACGNGRNRSRHCGAACPAADRGHRSPAGDPARGPFRQRQRTCAGLAIDQHATTGHGPCQLLCTARGNNHDSHTSTWGERIASTDQPHQPIPGERTTRFRLEIWDSGFASCFTWPIGPPYRYCSLSSHPDCRFYRGILAWLGPV